MFHRARGKKTKPPFRLNKKKGLAFPKAVRDAFGKNCVSLGRSRVQNLYLLSDCGCANVGGMWVHFEREGGGRSAELLRFKNDTGRIKWVPNSTTIIGKTPPPQRKASCCAPR